MRFTSPRLQGVLAMAVLASACTRTINLLNPQSPAFFGSYGAAAADSLEPTQLRIVTFNIKLSQDIGGAIRVLTSERLKGADILALEEMDETGVERIARALKLNYVYFPGIIYRNGHYFGPALLSRWPIERGWKVLLPHEGRLRHQRRTATGALLRIGNERVLAYAVHLETQLKISDRGREDQIMAILHDAEHFEGPTIIAGDFNSQGIGPFVEQQGYTWVTSRVGPTISVFSWDHIFVRHLTPKAAGLVKEVRGASDHRPVWAVVGKADAQAVGRRIPAYPRSWSPLHLPTAAATLIK
jgi:endonuclease/exonuclease/phosphatase family metal-dependent hydrolase